MGAVTESPFVGDDVIEHDPVDMVMDPPTDDGGVYDQEEVEASLPTFRFLVDGPTFQIGEDRQAFVREQIAERIERLTENGWSDDRIRIIVKDTRGVAAAVLDADFGDVKVETWLPGSTHTIDLQERDSAMLDAGLNAALVFNRSFLQSALRNRRVPTDTVGLMGPRGPVVTVQ